MNEIDVSRLIRDLGGRRLIAALIQAAGGAIEVSSRNLQGADDLELSAERRFDRDSIVYVTRRKGPSHGEVITYEVLPRVKDE